MSENKPTQRQLSELFWKAAKRLNNKRDGDVVRTAKKRGKLASTLGRFNRNNYRKRKEDTINDLIPLQQKRTNGQGLLRPYI